MKYIRTKDGVYEVSEENDRYYKCCYDVDRVTLVAKFDNDVNGFSKALNQSENLEELCDLVRFKTKDNATHYIDLHKNTIEDIVVHFGGKNIIIDSFRYCIETSKGLIYVAKMDNEGKLVLI